MKVPRERTPLSPAEMAPIFVRAYEGLTGEPPSRSVAEIGLAIVGLENANGHSIWDHNWGNIMWTGSGDYYEKKVAKAGQPTKWRAEPDHDRGARSWWSLIFRKYRPVLDAAARGDARGAVSALYSGGYVVAVRDPDWSDSKARQMAAREQAQYAAGVERHARSYKDKGLFASLVSVSRDTGRTAGWLFLAAAAVLFAWGWRKGEATR